MIYTITFNPSIDYIVSMDQFSMGKTNRTLEEKILPGGKGINVSTVLTNLGIANTALGFIAGFTGKEIQRLCEKHQICCDFIPLAAGHNRINVKFKNFEGTEINGTGPEISDSELHSLILKLQHLKEGDTVVFAGSVPPSLPSDIYQIFMKTLQSKNIDVVIDAAGDLLLNCLPYHPFLIKPNKQELEEIFHTTIQDKEDIIPYARQLQELGARNVLISLSGDGAIFLSQTGEVLSLDAPDGTFINGVGAGDSMIAGFLSGWQTTSDYRLAFHMAVAAGSASAYSEELATKTEILSLFSKIT